MSHTTGRIAEHPALTEDAVSKVIYLDNGATSFPKPPEVYAASDSFFRKYGVNPGRSGYDLCLMAGDKVEETAILWGPGSSCMPVAMSAVLTGLSST